MCISLLVPGRAIKIRYASESVYLKKFSGLPDIELDVLLQNESTSDISEIWCVVPQAINDVNGDIPFPHPFSDATKELDDPGPSGITHYTLLSDMQPPHLRLSLPSDDPRKTVCNLDGTYDMGNKVTFMKVSQTQRAMMFGMRFGIFLVTLAEPLKPRESRWMRLKIEPLTGPLQSRNRRHLIWDLITNRVHLSYDVSGPAQVPEEIVKKLTLLRRIIPKDRTNEKMKKMLLQELHKLTKMVVNKGLQMPGTSVTIEDWRTRFFRTPMDQFNPIRVEGSVIVMGDQLNYPAEHYPQNSYYEWATGTEHFEGSDAEANQGKFKIRFQTKYVSPLFHLLGLVGWLGFVMALVSFILSLIVICRA